MKIISKFKDYYDGVVNTYGIDEHIVFIRNNEIVETKKLPKLCLPNTNNYNRKKNKIKYTYNFCILGFCGIIYPILKILKETSDIGSNIINKTEINFIYDHEIIKDKFYKLFDQKNKWEKNKWDNYINICNNKEILNLFHENKISSFLLYLQSDSTIWETYQNIIFEKEPILNDLQFFKIKDPVTAFQDVSVFVAEQLNTEIDTFVMSDKQKILSRGFDEKYGFRKRPK